MNERIKELAHQADLVIKKSNGNDFRFGAMDPNLEKFAELIVRESIEVMKRHDYHGEWLGKKIREHFGVEE